jgi:hydrogenase large subunit
MATIAIDPITRIEGHLRIEAQIDNGSVTDAWSAGTAFRGIEKILYNRDPRDAWMFTQRICGVCTTVHAICTCRAVESALGIKIPANARLLRNIIEAAQYIYDHVMHFYHLHALDWVDVVSALSADPAATGTLQRSISDWSNNSTAYFTAVKTRLQKLVTNSQLGPFANGYWGHPAYQLSPEANLLLTAHYLEALDFQREFVKFHAILGGKNPHLQTYAVGGMAIPLHQTSANAINPTTIATLKSLAQQGLDFVTKVYMPDVKLAAGTYKAWANVGGGVVNYLSLGDFPQDDTGSITANYLQRGVVLNRNLAAAPAALDANQIMEWVSRSWYTYAGGDVGLHPSAGETTVQYTGPTPPYQNLDTASGRYSFVKTPRYNGLPMEVGPLARVAVAYAAGHVRVRQLTDQLLAALTLPSTALFSTLGRVAARAIETQVLAEQLGGWLDQLLANINAGNLTTVDQTKWSTTTWPKTAVSGWGATEAPRGALGHWVTISGGKITKYQAVVPTTWNGSPRDKAGVRGPFEQALVGQTVADPTRPLELLRTIHSFDPCMACAVHIVDAKKRPLMKVADSFMRA